MPNWVYNGLTIEGNPEYVTKLVEQMNQPFLDYITPNGDLAFGIKETKYSNPIFSFRNIIAPTDLEAYKAQPVSSELDLNDPNWWADTQRLSETDNSWYNWNVRNWGVKWDVAVSSDEEYPDTYIEGPVQNGDNLVVYYNFNTAWGIAEPALAELSSQYPYLLFTLGYEEETGWGGELEILRGKFISHSQYESKCVECDKYDTLEFCEDCENNVCSFCGYGREDECQSHMIESELPPKVQVTENA